MRDQMLSLEAISGMTDRLSHNSNWARVQDRDLWYFRNHHRGFLYLLYPTEHQVMGGWATSVPGKRIQEACPII